MVIEKENIKKIPKNEDNKPENNLNPIIKMKMPIQTEEIKPEMPIQKEEIKPEISEKPKKESLPFKFTKTLNKNDVIKVG
jgi:uncharacterized protein YukJ